MANTLQRPWPRDREALLDEPRLHAVEDVQPGRRERVPSCGHHVREVHLDAPVGLDQRALVPLERSHERLVALHRRLSPKLLELRGEQDLLDEVGDVAVNARDQERAELPELALERARVDLVEERVGDLARDGRHDRLVGRQRRHGVDITVLVEERQPQPQRGDRDGHHQRRGDQQHGHDPASHLCAECRRPPAAVSNF